MTRKSFLGVVGFTSSRQVESVIKALKQPSRRCRLMVGVHVSLGTILGEDYPLPDWCSVDHVPRVFPAKNAGVYNVVVYDSLCSCQLSDCSLIGQLVALVNLAAPNVDAIELNVGWPELADVRAYLDLPSNRAKPEIILGLDEEALAEIGFIPQAVARRLADYEGVAGFIIRPTGGYDACSRVEYIGRVLEEAACYAPSLQPGFTLGCDEFEAAAHILERFPLANLEIIPPAELCQVEQAWMPVNIVKYLELAARYRLW